MTTLLADREQLMIHQTSCKSIKRGLERNLSLLLRTLAWKKSFSK